jgi:hypothetical protein
MKKFNNKNKKIKKKSVKPNTKEIEKKKKVSALEDEEILKLQESYKEVLYLCLYYHVVFLLSFLSRSN